MQAAREYAENASELGTRQRPMTLTITVLSSFSLALLFALILRLTREESQRPEVRARKGARW